MPGCCQRRARRRETATKATWLVLLLAWAHTTSVAQGLPTLRTASRWGTAGACDDMTNYLQACRTPLTCGALAWQGGNREDSAGSGIIDTLLRCEMGPAVWHGAVYAHARSRWGIATPDSLLLLVL